MPYFPPTLSAVVDDLAPRLGGNLNQNGFSISGLVIGTDVQAQNANLQALAALSSAANRMPYFTGSGAAALASLTAYARTLIDDADASTARATLGITTGNYNPTYSNVSNCSALTAIANAQWVRIGDIVIVSGGVNIDPIGASLLTRFSMTLPVASNLANAGNLSGVAFSSASASLGGAIEADATNDLALFRYINTSDLSARDWYFIFMYRVI